MKIGITGGIGSGKSFICNMLRQRGFPVYNCDEEAKRLMVKSKVIIEGLRRLIGMDAYEERHVPGGEESEFILNKTRIAAYLFANKDNAAKVNAIVHPAVKEDFRLWCEQQDSKFVFMECAILFESGFEDAVDKTVLVYSDKDKRLQRAMKRDNATKEQIESRMKQQITDDEALERADFILNNNEYDTTDEQFQKMLSWLITNQQSLKQNA